MDFVVAYCEGYSTHLKTSKHHFIQRMAGQGHRVLILEVPKHPLSKKKGFILFNKSQKPKQPTEIHKNIYSAQLSVPLPYTRRLFGIFDSQVINLVNQKFLRNRIMRLFGQLKFESPILISYFPFIEPIIDDLKFSKVIFHIVDEWQGFGNIPHSMKLLTQSMLKKADLTVVSSQPLLKRYKPWAKKMILLRHGTDLAIFDQNPKILTKNTQEQERRIKIGYYGALHKINYCLVKKVAVSLPDWKFIFLGPIEDRSQGLKAHIELPPNVYLKESISRSDLPRFLQTLDAFWAPFVDNELTHFMSPIKLFEVLSFGLPIICQDLPECRSIIGNCGSLAIDAQDHSKALVLEVSTDNHQKTKDRKSMVKNSDWETVYQKFIKAIENA